MTLSIRPEDVVLQGRQHGHGPAITLDAVVRKVTYAGREAFYGLLAAGDLPLLAHVYRPDDGRLESVGARVTVELPLTRLHAFDADDGRRVDLAP